MKKDFEHRNGLVRPKKALGQHFLTDLSVAQKIADALVVECPPEAVRPLPVLEIGPGMGVLSQYLLEREDIDLKMIEIDRESVDYLLVHFPKAAGRIIEGDFLRMNLACFFPPETPSDRADRAARGADRSEGGAEERKQGCDTPARRSRDTQSRATGTFAVIGNFPYNISSQIFFRIIDHKDSVPQVVCMIQKEVAERIAEQPGSKTYGILSVLLQAWYEIEYLFTVGEGAFNPPPKVKSAVIRLRRNSRIELGCDEKLFKTVVKTAFNQRRKTLRNSLKPLVADKAGREDWSPEKTADFLSAPVFELRPERLGVEDFVALTNLLAL